MCACKFKGDVHRQHRAGYDNTPNAKCFTSEMQQQQIVDRWHTCCQCFLKQFCSILDGPQSSVSLNRCALTEVILRSSNTDTLGWPPSRCLGPEYQLKTSILDDPEMRLNNQLTSSRVVYFTFTQIYITYKHVCCMSYPVHSKAIQNTICTPCWEHVFYCITTVIDQGPLSPWPFWLLYGHSKLQLVVKIE